VDKKKIEIIITGLLVVVLGVLVIVNTKKRGSPKKRPVQGEPAILATSTGIKSVKADKDTIALQRERTKLAWGRDPFFFTRPKKIYKGTTLLLKGISLGKDKTVFALINDQIVTTGDAVEGYKVLEIQKDKVLLRKGSDSFYLAMPKESFD